MAKRTDKELDHIRREFNLDQLNESTLPGDPLILFKAWMDEAIRLVSPDPTAMTLSTVDGTGSPSSRIVLLKKIQENRLIFFTNYNSRKAREIQNTPKVAAHLFWPLLERQVKIEGLAEHVKDEISDLYFSSRPFESKVSAWASPQSEMVPDRDFLEREYLKYLERFKASKEIPRPQFWGGIAIKPLRMEFWQGGRYRLHDRIEYTLKDNSWSRVRLAP
jgi:pyridoxamine 5'-phosphate oxidase